jgi:chromosome segregation ATPase
MWISAGLAVVVVALLIWGLTTRSDLDDTQAQLDSANQQVAQLKTEAEQNKGVAGTITEVAKGAYDQLAQQLGTTTEDLAATQQDLSTAQQEATKAEQAATEATQAVDQATSATEKAKATADDLRAQADAAKAKGTVAASCAKASIAAIGQLFEGESVQAQAQAVRQQLQTIGADCKSAFAGG